MKVLATVVLAMVLRVVPVLSRHEYPADWWEHGVFYQIYPRSFKDSDGDGVGDLQGILEKVDHLVDLGVTGVWLSPVFQSPMADFGYDVSDFRQIDKVFGTMNDFEDLLAALHSADIKVILDFVPNHTSDEHAWFVDAMKQDDRFRNFYVWRTGTQQPGGVRYPPNNWVSVFHTPAWTRLANDAQFYMHQFDSKQPDLNYRNPQVRYEMDDVMRYWLEKGVDGFRIGAVDRIFEDPELRDELTLDSENADGGLVLGHSRTTNLPESYELVYDWRELLEQYGNQSGTEGKLMMTEAYANLEDTMKWFGNGIRRGAHIPFNFCLINALDGNARAEDFKRQIDGWLTSMPSYASGNWVLGNHDSSRAATRFGAELASSIAVLQMTLPGIAIVYYGEELGMEDNPNISWAESKDPQGCNTNATVFRKYTRDMARTPFQWDGTPLGGFSPDGTYDTWLPVHPNYPQLNLAAQKIAPKSMYRLYKDLIDLRKEATFEHGGYQSYVLVNNVFGFIRSLEGHSTYAIAVNINTNEVSLNLKHMHSSTEQASVVYMSLNSLHQKDDDIVDVENVVLGRHEAVIFKLRSAGPVRALSHTLLTINVLQLLAWVLLRRDSISEMLSVIK